MLWNYFRNDDCKVTKFSLKFQIYLKLFLKKVTFERKVGFEPTTPCLEGRRSSQLSYSRNFYGMCDGDRTRDNDKRTGSQPVPANQHPVHTPYFNERILRS